MFARAKYARETKRERGMSPFIPQRSHINHNTIITKSGDLQRTWRVQGIAFETADPEDLHRRKEQMNMLFRSIGSSHVAVWAHTCPKLINDTLPGEFANPFVRRMNDKYYRRVNKETMLVNELYLTLVYRPSPSAVSRNLIRAARRSADDIVKAQYASLQKLNEYSQLVETSLAKYKLHCLETFYDEHDVLCSEALSFLNYLITGNWQKVAVPDGPLDDALGNAWVNVGTEMIEIRLPGRVRYAMSIDLKDYNKATFPGILNDLLYGGCEFTLTQSFSAYSKRDGDAELKQQRRYLQNTEDGSATQIQDMDAAIDGLASGEFVLGEYHFNLMLFGDTPEECRAITQAATSIIQDRGFLASLVTTATDAAFYAQLPCNWPLRPRIAKITSRNFAGMAAMHNFPLGKRDGNPWGQAVSMLKTSSGGPFYFNFHVATSDLDKLDKMLAGNTSLIGHTGGGKTVLMVFLQMQLQKYNQGRGKFNTVYFDKNQGARVAIKAQGGNYKTFRNGEPTGINPFQWEPTERNILFLGQLVQVLVTANGGTYTTRDQSRVDQAVRTVMKMPRPMRGPSTLLQSITESNVTEDRENSVAKRLARWCAENNERQRGAMAWVLDNEDDQLDFSTHTNHGFDGTDFLDNPEVRTPIAMCLLHRMDEIIDGRRFGYFMDESPKWLDDPFFMGFAGDKQMTIRKLNGFGVFGTQIPETFLNSPISAELNQQMATEIYLPNPKARRVDYVDGFGLTEAEFRIVQELEDEDHMFLVKQEKQSVVVHLDLHGFEDELAVMSGSPEHNELYDEVVADVGEDPDVWLPEFHKRRRQLVKGPGSSHAYTIAEAI